MARFNDISNAFLAGELSPRALGRTDLPIHKQGLTDSFNKIVYPQGGFARRPGSIKMASGYSFLYGPDLNGDGFPDSVNKSQGMPINSRGFPLTFSKTESYIIFIAAADTPFIVSDNGSGLTSLAYIAMYHPVLDKWEYPRPPLDPGLIGRAYQKGFVPPANLQALRELQYSQTGSLVMFTHPSIPPFYVRQRAPASAAFSMVGGTFTSSFECGMFYDSISDAGRGASSGIDYVNNWPFLDMNIDQSFTIGLNNVAAGANATATASKPLWDAGHIGCLFRLTDNGSTTTGVFVVRSITSSTVAQVYNLKAGHNNLTTTPGYQWEEAAWSGVRGWPRAICFYENRAVYGGNKFQPDTLWGSQSYDIFELAARRMVDAPISGLFPTGAGETQKSFITNQQPFAFTLTSPEPNQIQWLASGKSLVIGTHGREWTSSSEDAIGPLNPAFSPETSHGSAYVQPVRIQNSTIFIQRSGKKVREFTYNWAENSFKSDEVSFFADHMVRKMMKKRASFLPGEFVQIAHQEADNQITWFIDNNGGLVGMTRDREKDVAAWHYHELGGVFAGEAPKVVSIWTLPSADGTHDDLWMMVRRSTYFGDTTFVEKIGQEFQLDTLVNSSTNTAFKPIYMDSATLIRFGTATSAIVFGLDDYIDKEICIIADGSYIGKFTVPNTGQLIGLPVFANEFIFGFPYRSYAATTNFDAGSNVGSAQGTIKRIDTATIRFNRAIGAKFGYDLTKLEVIPMRPNGLAPGTPTPIFSGDKTLKFPGDYDRYARVMVVQDDPLPCGVTCIVARGQTYD